MNHCLWGMGTALKLLGTFRCYYEVDCGRLFNNQAFVSGGTGGPPLAGLTATDSKHGGRCVEVETALTITSILPRQPVACNACFDHGAAGRAW